MAEERHHLIELIQAEVRETAGELVRRDLLPVRFVPVTGAMQP